MSKVLKPVKIAADDDEWLDAMADSSIGYLLFKNGIYNMNTGVFTKGFNPNIVFYARIPRDYPERNEDEIKYAMKLSFGLLLDKPKPLIVALAIALSGNTNCKKFYFCPGKTNAGKSKLVNMFTSAFGSYIGIFNAEDFSVSCKMDSKDEAAKYRWALLLRFKRIIFSNEANMKRKMDSSKIKKFSAGDKVVGRLHGCEEVHFKPHFTPFCMLNDIPDIAPLDKPTMGRLVYCEFNKQFVAKPVKGSKTQKKADNNIDKKIADSKFINGFIHIILDGYKYFLKNGDNKALEFDNEIKNEWTQDLRDEDKIKNLMSQYFNITNNTKDTVLVSDMNKFKNSQKLGISARRFNEILNDDLKITQDRSNSARRWIGIMKKVNPELD